MTTPHVQHGRVVADDKAVRWASALDRKSARAVLDLMQEMIETVRAQEAKFLYVRSPQVRAADAWALLCGALAWIANTHTHHLLPFEAFKEPTTLPSARRAKKPKPRPRKKIPL